MSAFYAFGGLLLLLLVVVVVSALRDREVDPIDLAGADPVDRLEEALAALREIEFEYRSGKLSEEEYRRLREARGRDAIRARDEVTAAAEAAERVEGRSCEECGEPIPADARFCGRCGQPLDAGGG